MKTGERLVVGLLGCVWTGVRAYDGQTLDRVNVTTVHEDHPHGANMQATAVINNLAFAARLSGALAERLTISADNTVKETKNNTFLNFIVWLLCCLRSTPLWVVRTVYKIVGHTHDDLDRFYSRVGMSLRGHTYISKQEMQRIVSDTLTSYDISWVHSAQTFDFETVRERLGVHMKRMRNTHDLEVFRTDAGVCVRWKQWMTDERWSSPRLVVPFDEMQLVAAMQPAVLPHEFPTQKVAGGLALVDRLEGELLSTVGLTDKITRGLADIRASWRGQDQGPRFSMQELLKTLTSCALGASFQSVFNNAADLHASIPSDVLYQSCPGHDVVGVPVESLVELEVKGIPLDVQTTEPECCLGSFVITRCTSASKLPFAMGVLRDLAGELGLVEWLHPLKSTERKFASGKKKQILDIFGRWLPVDSFQVGDLEELPKPLVDPKDILLWNFELTEDSEIPFSTLDQLLDVHGIDFTGLSLSATHRGNLYRTHRLMQGNKPAISKVRKVLDQKNVLDRCTI